ncbi:MAG TPA: primosomal protein N' [Candidatus Nitrosotalea sp.]|nr:primosomal protein N' [Candidatus Nitrosotalea sp.]
MRVVDALPVIRSSRFDLPLTHDAGELDLAPGEIVRARLGSREVLAFVLSAPRTIEPPPKPLKAVAARLDVPRAFDETGLHLARFMAEQYICTLGEALGTVVLADALPRMRDSFVRGERPSSRGSAIPSRFVRLIWDELDDEFSLEQLLRHPEARRAGDRGTLLSYIRALVRSGALRRERRLTDPRTSEYRVRVLDPGEAPIKGAKAAALAAFVRRCPGVPRADALLAGFSNAVIVRAIRANAIRERLVVPALASRARTISESAMRPNAAQAKALRWIEDAIEAGDHAAALLYGVTGSGKTFVYVEAIKRAVRRGGSAIVLVPEISLTPQTAQRFEAAFGERVAVLHSALSQRERFDAWQSCARGEIDVVVGARSAIFAPLRNVKLVVVDEAHDPSYKQESAPRYQAVAVARERMRHEGGVLLLGSATPSLESYAAALQGRIAMLELPARATAQPLPRVRVVDLRKEFESGNRGIFSSALVQGLADRLQRGEKSLLFVNRRGSAGAQICRTCGTVPHCPRCTVALSVHRAERLLRCHYCDYQSAIPRRCAACGSDAVAELGIGTERVVEEVRRLFADARVMRMDSDTTTRIGDHSRILSEFEAVGDVLVGTQMVAKGLDYPTVTLAAVVAADLGLAIPDFRAAERSFALIAQVCGRSGRMRRGEAIVQTYAPDHPAIRFAAAHDYAGFAEAELAERTAAGFPPARRLIYLGVIGRDRRRAAETAQRYAGILREQGAEVLGPAPYSIARVNDEWRYRVALRGRRPAAMRALVREHILKAARKERATRLAINVDP